MVEGGYAGKILRVDLTESRVEMEDLNLGDAEKFIGGLGMNVKLARGLVEPGTDAFSAENPIIIGAGPLVGTYAPGATRVFATSKLPINGAVGWCGGGGMNFGAMMKYAGFDHLIVRGKAEKPVYLKVFDDGVEVRDASSLWGRGIDRSTNELWEKYGRASGVISIGQGGENLVKFSMAFVDRASTLGRGGLGAVFGSKNLKAIVAKGNKGIEVSDERRFRKVCNDLYERIENYPELEDWQELGLLKSLPLMSKEFYRSKLFKARMACIGCPIGDKDYLRIGEGKFKGFTKITTSAVNTGLPKLYGIDDYQEQVKIVARLDDYGLDMFEFFSVFDMARQLSSEGLLEGYSDVKIEYDYEIIMEWIEKVATRRGLGDVLAEGVDVIVEEFGRKSEEFAPPTCKGLTAYVGPDQALPWEFMGTMELGLILEPRGAHVASGGSPTYFARRPLEKFPRLLGKFGVPEEALERIIPGLEDLKVGMLLKYSQDNFAVMASLGICARAQINRFYYPDLYPELHAAATGIEKTKEELLKCGERTYNLLRSMNVREGFDSRDEIPEQWFDEPRFKEYVSKEEVTRGMVEEMMNDYYEERGWDPKTGTPTKQKLEELGLGEEMESW